MSFIGSGQKLLTLSLFAMSLVTAPLFAQQDNNAPQQPASAPAQQQSTTTQAQQGNNAQAQSTASVQAQPAGITASSLAVAPSPKFPLPTGTDYSNGVHPFPNMLAPYRVRNVPEANFANAPKLESMIQDGKIMLSLDDAIALALADNLDLAIARYNLPIADTDILRTKAGSSIFGVGTALVEGTLGGGGIAATGGASGTGAGGTAVGAGGVGAGASGIVGNTFGLGPTADSWDPVILGTLEQQHGISPTTSTLLTGGLSQLETNTGTANFTYQQGFSYGTLLQVSYNNSRTTTNEPLTTLSPQLSSNFTVSLRQHLLQGWGWAVQRRWLTIARDNKRATQESFRNQVSYTVSQIEDIYWDLVAAYEDVKVKERSLALDEKTLSDNRKQVEIGTMAPISVVQAESAVAADKQSVLTAHSTLQLQQLYMKSAISRNMVTGSDVMKADVVPTDTVVVPEQEPQMDVEALIQRGLQDNPLFIENKLNLKDSLLSIQGTNNLLRPTVDLIGFYGASSIGGAQNPAGVCTLVNPSNPIEDLPLGCTPAGTIPPSGFGNAFTNLFNSSAPDKGVILNITIPLRNRVAQAQQVRSQLEYRQAELRFKQLQNNYAINIRNEVFALEQDRASIMAAREAQTFAEQNLDAEQKKYALGASTSFNVMNMQAQLAVAQEKTISAEISYAKQRVQLDLDTAQTLDNNNIIVGEAVTGQIKTQPKVQGVGPNTFIEQTGPPPNPPAPQLTPRPNEPNPPQQQPPQ
jgi:outer membrane protein